MNLYFLILIICLSIISLILACYSIYTFYKEYYTEKNKMKFMISRGEFGLQKMCDWIIDNHSDTIVKKNGITKPRTIFVKADPEYWEIFLNTVLPEIQTSFILISGSADRTTPNQIDLRYDSYRGTRLGEQLHKLADDSRISKWFLENCDEKLSPKMHLFPLGARGDVFDNDLEWHKNAWEIALKPCNMKKKGIKTISINRTRTGGNGQWKQRAKVLKLLKGNWKNYIDYKHADIPSNIFVKELSKYSFVLCVEGGGLDPSPKAWQAIIAGSIPIIRKTQIYEAYKDFPCAWIDEWTEDAITPTKLKKWLEELSPWFDDPSKRNKILHKLTLKYWWCDVMGQDDRPFLYIN